MPYKDKEKARANLRERRKRPDVKAREKAYREKTAEQRKKWSKDNKERRAAYMREWRIKNKDHRKEYKRQYEQETHREQHLQRIRAYRAKNKDKLLAQRREWGKTSPKMKAWRENNADKLRLQARLKAAEHYIKRREFFRELYAMKGAHRCSRTSILYVKWELCNELCYICGERVEFGAISIDHVVPKKLGGTNEIQNLMPTHLLCNKKKNHRLNYPVIRPDLVIKTAVIQAHPRRVGKYTNSRFENGIMRKLVYGVGGEANS